MILVYKNFNFAIDFKDYFKIFQDIFFQILRFYGIFCDIFGIFCDFLKIFQDFGTFLWCTKIF